MEEEEEEEAGLGVDEEAGSVHLFPSACAFFFPFSVLYSSSSKCILVHEAENERTLFAFTLRANESPPFEIIAHSENHLSILF